MEKQSVSTIVRKPWGGQLEAEQEPLPAPRERDSFDWMLLLLRKLAELSLLSALIAVPLMYHFSLDMPRLQAIGQFLGGTDFFYDQVQPYLGGMMPTLESKFSAWFVSGIMMMVGYAAMRITGSLGKRSPYGEGTDAEPSRRKVHRFVPLLCIGGFLVYAFVSFLIWPPAVPPDAIVASPGVAAEAGGITGFISNLGGGGFFYSTIAWLQVVFGLIFFLVAEDIIRERRFVGKIFGLIVLVGLINAVIVVLQKVEFGPLVDIWVKFGEADARNRLGAFIGHNTGVASFLITPLLVALTWVLSILPRKSQLLRLSLAMSVLFMALAMLLTQSRAVLPITVILAIILIVILIRRSSLLPQSRLYIWFPVALVFVLLTQFIPVRHNPLYRRDITFTERLGEFRPERLQTETRLRILLVSATELIPDSPLVGHGFGTFQFVYPSAQGRYFQEYPNSSLAPTPNRTQRAHNEYLQTLIETGVVGLAIALCGLFFVLRGGWRVMQRTLMPHHIAMQAAIICSIAGILLHALVDFPLRVPPLALTLVVLLAVWSAGDRLWLFPMHPPVEEDDMAIPTTEEKRPGNPVMLTAGSIAVLALFVSGAIALFSTAVNPFLSVATMVNRGNQLLTVYMETRDVEALRRGFQEVYSARRIYWISGPVSRLNAQGRYFQAGLNYRAADYQADQSQMPEAARTRAFAETLASAGISDVNMAFSEENFDRLYVLRSQLHDLVGRNSFGARREEYLRKSRNDLELAAKMNPGNVYTLLEYIEVLENQPVLNRAKIVSYLRIMNHFHPTFFERNVFSRVLDAMSLGAGEDAYLKAQMIAEAIPGEPVYRQVLAATALAAGDIDRAQELARIIREETDSENQMYLQEADLILIRSTIKKGDFEAALNDLRPADQYDYVEPSYIKTLRLNLLERTGAPQSEIDRVRQEIDALGERDANQYRTAGYVAYNIFQDYDEAAHWLEKREEVRRRSLERDLLDPFPEMDLQGLVVLARSYAALGEWDKIREGDLLEKIRDKAETSYARRLAYDIANEISDQAREAGVDLSVPAAKETEDTP